jgi:iron-sulfur cluster repair protein YtfE (RIC family)
MLEQDHRKVEKLFQQYEKAKEPERKRQVFQQIRNELEVHAQIEERVFYPKAEQAGEKELKEQVEEAHGEHDKVKQMLREADSLDPASGEFDALVSGVKGAVEHHVQEEEGEMFDKARGSMTEDDLAEVARRMTELRSELRAGAGNGSGGENRSLVGRLMGR